MLPFFQTKHICDPTKMAGEKQSLSQYLTLARSGATFTDLEETEKNGCVNPKIKYIFPVQE